MCTKLTAVDRLGSGIQISANFLKVPGVVSRLGSGLHVVGQLGSECDLVPIFSRIFALTAGENVLAGKGNCPGGGNFRRKMSEGGMSWGKYRTLRCLYRALLISNLCNRQTKKKKQKNIGPTTDYRETEEIKTVQIHLQQIGLRESPTAIRYFWHSSAKPAKRFTAYNECACYWNKRLMLRI